MMSDKDIEEYHNLSRDIKWNKKFTYPKTQREIVKGLRHYNIETEDSGFQVVEKLPSVTTILSQTQTKEKQESLARWQAKVGKNEATRIKDQAAARGTTMHHYLEGWLTEKYHIDLTDVGQAAEKMAYKIYDEGLRKNLEEIWGSEVTLWYPDLYAGQTDVVGIYNGRESIIDFKQTNKPKKREWIDDYFLQLAAYAMAHNCIYNTEIQQGVVLMCSKDGYFQKFEVSDEEFKQYKFKWLARVDQYYKRLE